MVPAPKILLTTRWKLKCRQKARSGRKQKNRPRLLDTAKENGAADTYIPPLGQLLQDVRPQVLDGQPCQALFVGVRIMRPASRKDQCEYPAYLRGGLTEATRSDRSAARAEPLSAACRSWRNCSVESLRNTPNRLMCGGRQCTFPMRLFGRRRVAERQGRRHFATGINDFSNGTQCPLCFAL